MEEPVDGEATASIRGAIIFGVIGVTVGALIAGNADDGSTVTLGIVLWTVFGLLLFVGLVAKGVELGVRSAREQTAGAATGAATGDSSAGSTGPGLD